MLNRIKQTLVDSYIGAIALGWLLAQSVSHLASAVAAPVAGSISRSHLRGLMDSSGTLPGFTLTDAVPQLVTSACLLLFWYLLLRWLYWRPVSTPASSQHPEQEA